MNEHEGHRLMTARGWYADEEEHAWLVCVDCQSIAQPLGFCGRRTKKGEPCRVTVRSDLGHTTCKAHDA